MENKHRGGSRTAATSKMERFAIIVNGFQPLTIITKRSILDVAATLDPPLVVTIKFSKQVKCILILLTSNIVSVAFCFQNTSTFSINVSLNFINTQSLF